MIANSSSQPLACVLGAMDIVRPLGVAGIRCHVVSAPLRPARYSRFTIGTTKAVDPYRQPHELVERLLAFAQTQVNRPVLYYDNDGYLALVSRFRDELAAHFVFVVPRAALVEDLIDKRRFLSLAGRAQLPVPATCYLPTGFAAADLDLPFPLILKPLTRDDRDRAWLDVGGHAKALRYDTRSDFAASLQLLQRSGISFVAQTLIHGPETAIESYHVYADCDGCVIAEFAGRKIRTLPPEFGHSTALITTDASDVVQLGRQIVAAIGFTGVGKFDFKRDASGKLHLLEINPRFTLWNHLGARAGVNIPALVFADLIGRGRPPIGSARAGVTWCDVWKDARAARLADVPFSEWVRWLAACDVKADLALDDPLPFIVGKVAARPINAATRLLGRVVRVSDLVPLATSPTTSEVSPARARESMGIAGSAIEPLPWRAPFLVRHGPRTMRVLSSGPSEPANVSTPTAEGRGGIAAGEGEPAGRTPVDKRMQLEKRLRRSPPNVRAPIDVAVFDAEQRQSLVAVRSLGRHGLRVGSFGSQVDSPAFYSKWSTTRRGVHDCATDTNAFVRDVEDVVNELAPRVIIPTHDGSIEALRAMRLRLPERTAVAIAADGALEIAVDKSRTLELARQLGIRIPHTVLVTNASDLEAALDEVGLPAVFKPVRSWMQEGDGGSRFRAVVVVNVAEAHDALRELATQGRTVAVQEWLSGAREAVSVVYADRQFYARFAQVAHRMNPPLGGSSVLRESIDLPPDLVDAAEALVSAAGLEGYSEVEFRRGADGQPRLMEINPRLSASVEIAVRAGLGLPLLLYQWAAGLPMQHQNAYRVGVRVRWLGGDIRWLRTSLRTQGRPDVPSSTDCVARFVGDFFRRGSYDYVDRSDVRPAVVAARHFIVRAVRERTDRVEL